MKKETKINYPVVFDGRRYRSIEHFDCRTVHLSTDFPGSFATTIPISGKSSKTLASIEIKSSGGWTTFEITDDWGIRYIMKIHNSLEENISSAKLAASERYLLKC